MVNLLVYTETGVEIKSWTLKEHIRSVYNAANIKETEISFKNAYI